MNNLKDLLNIVENREDGLRNQYGMITTGIKEIILAYDNIRGFFPTKGSYDELNSKRKEALKEFVDEIIRKGEQFKRVLVESLLEAHVVGDTILKQLGGNKFIAMTGAKNFVGVDEYTIGFKIGRNSKGVNYVKIHLNGMDTYDMMFINIRNGVLKFVSKADGVYNDMLQSTFTKHTGMYTSLGTMGR